MGTQANPHGGRNGDDMPAEIDFSKGTRAKFFKADTRLSLPVYLEADVQDYLAARAKACGIKVGQLVNELLKKDIELIGAARQPFRPAAGGKTQDLTPKSGLLRSSRRAE